MADRRAWLVYKGDARLASREWGPYLFQLLQLCPEKDIRHALQWVDKRKGVFRVRMADVRAVTETDDGLDNEGELREADRDYLVATAKDLGPRPKQFAYIGPERQWEVEEEEEKEGKEGKEEEEKDKHKKKEKEKEEEEEGAHAETPKGYWAGQHSEAMEQSWQRWRFLDTAALQDGSFPAPVRVPYTVFIDALVVRLQAMVRGMRTRRVVREAHPTFGRTKELLAEEEARLNAEQAERDLADEEAARQAWEEKRHAQAVRLQAVFRGFAARKWAKLERVERLVSEEERAAMARLVEMTTDAERRRRAEEERKKQGRSVEAELEEARRAEEEAERKRKEEEQAKIREKALGHLSKAKAEAKSLRPIVPVLYKHVDSDGASPRTIYSNRATPTTFELPSKPASPMGPSPRRKRVKQSSQSPKSLASTQPNLLAFAFVKPTPTERRYMAEQMAAERAEREARREERREKARREAMLRKREEAARRRAELGSDAEEDEDDVDAMATTLPPVRPRKRATGKRGGQRGDYDPDVARRQQRRRAAREQRNTYNALVLPEISPRARTMNDGYYHDKSGRLVYDEALDTRRQTRRTASRAKAEKAAKAPNYSLNVRTRRAKKALEHASDADPRALGFASEKVKFVDADAWDPVEGGSDDEGAGGPPAYKQYAYDEGEGEVREREPSRGSARPLPAAPVYSSSEASDGEHDSLSEGSRSRASSTDALYEANLTRIVYDADPAAENAEDDSDEGAPPLSGFSAAHPDVELSGVVARSAQAAGGEDA